MRERGRRRATGTIESDRREGRRAFSDLLATPTVSFCLSV